MLDVADQKAHILARRKQRRGNLDENFLPSARAQAQPHVHASHPPATELCPITVTVFKAHASVLQISALAANAFTNIEGRKGNR